MPVLEFLCPLGHVTEKFYKTISEGAAVEAVQCERCHELNRLSIAAKTIITPPLEAMLYGNPDGYHKPSATKRFNTKTVSQIEGNSSAVG